MAEPLKHFFDRELIRRLGRSIRHVHPRFPLETFVAESARGLGRLELMGRGHRIANALANALPADFEESAGILIRSLGPRPADGQLTGMAPFYYLPHVLYAARCGTDHFEAAMRLQYELTCRFTAEFSIRVFLLRYPEATLTRLREWAQDPDDRVRRLVSEGTRPRLPWAARLPAFQVDPAPVLSLLEILKDDPSLYVRRSVANSLNDIAKDHPDLAVATAERWLAGATAERRWVVEHALRWLVKAGHTGAIRALGFRGGEGIVVTGTVSPARVNIGDRVTVSISLRNGGQVPCRAAVDYAVHFVKADGRARPRVFKGREVELGPGDSATVERRLSLLQRTTRTHYPGLHRVEAMVNGVAHRLGNFRIRAPSS